jgi:hypothetical protein
MGDRWGIFSATAALLLAACGGDDPLGVSAGTPDAGAEPPATLAKFSFFYTSLDAMRRLSGSTNGFGGDLRYGTGSGLTGADKICQTIAADVDVGFGAKTWRAFLSVVAGPDGQPVHARPARAPGGWAIPTTSSPGRTGRDSCAAPATPAALARTGPAPAPRARSAWATAGRRAAGATGSRPTASAAAPRA